MQRFVFLIILFFSFPFWYIVFAQETSSQGTPFKGNLIHKNGKDYIVDDSGKEMEILSGKNAASLMYQFAQNNHNNGQFKAAQDYYQNCLDSMLLVNDLDESLILKSLEGVKSIERETKNLVYFRSENVEPGSYSRLYLYVGDLHLSKGEFNESKYYYEKSIYYDDKNPVTYNHLGIALDNLESFPDALKSYKLSLKYDPENPEVFYNIACSYSLQKNKKDSLTYLKIAITEKKYRISKNAILADKTIDFIKSEKEFQQIIKDLPETTK